MSTTGPSSTKDISSSAASQADTLVNQDSSTTNFTATGRPMSTTKPSGLSNIPGGGGFTAQTPQFLPVKFHDEDIIPVPVLVAKNNDDEVRVVEEKRGFMGKMKGLVSGSGKEKGDRLRVVYMPRGEYLKYFAKDDEGNYTGTEPQKSWSDQELDKAYGQYAVKSN